MFAQHLEKHDRLRMLLYSSLPQVCKHAAKTKTQPNLYVFGKWETRHLYYFGGMNEKELKTSQLRTLRSIYLILRGMKT